MTHLYSPSVLGSDETTLDAIKTFQALLTSEPENVALLRGLSSCLRAANRFREALSCLESVVQIEPDNAHWLCELGALYEELGNFPEAIKAFRRALVDRSSHPAAIARLLALREGLNDATLADQARQYLESQLDVPPLRMQLHFALAKHADLSGNYDAAFHHYREANVIAAVGRRYESEGVEARASQLISSFDRALLSARHPWGNMSDRPVFIVGMPRSGTTLTEQILASHARVAGAGELSYFDSLHFTLAQDQSAAENPFEYAQKIGSNALRCVAAGYLDVLKAESKDAVRVVDKMPTNFWYLGLIAMAFPKARIIHCRRNPLDTCLSCYFEDFYENLSYRVRLESLGHYYRQYVRIMDHWNAVLDVPMLEIHYEDTVEDLEKQARRVVEFCGLAWDANCLSFHRNPRVIRSPSRWQVRQPIYSSSVARWRRYEHHLAPLRQALGVGE
jgi:hypothetical protein